MSTTPELSRTPTLVNRPAVGKQSALRKYLSLLLFCLAQFLDAFNNSALFSAIPIIAQSLGLLPSERVWLISAYQLTFAAFLLVSGRISDIYSPKPAFISGAFVLGALSIGMGFVHNKVALLILRAFSGIAASLTIPSAYSLIVHLFPEPTEQSRAIGLFGASGALGNVLGLIIGALFVQLATWSWVFWFTSLIAMPISLICIFLIPSQNTDADDKRPTNLDLVGVTTLTVALILFIFAVTSASTNGWASAGVLAPLIISIFLVAGFLYYETRIPEHKAALPPKVWFYPNFSVLFSVALIPYFWWVTVFLLYTTLWQSVDGWSPLKSAIHFLPIGISAFPGMTFAGPLAQKISVKRTMQTGLVLLVIATVMFPFASGPAWYWKLNFLAFILGTVGNSFLFTTTSIAMFQTTPPEIAGTIGAIFNAALQLGSAVGSAAVSSIEASVEARHPEDPRTYKGRAAAFWFLLGIVALEALAVSVFYRAPRGAAAERVEYLEKTPVSEAASVKGVEAA